MRIVSLFLVCIKLSFILKAYVSDAMDSQFIDSVCIVHYLTKLCVLCF
uniref:Uncharacterized protein n=1 Tax=Arundo donax TaxID=35708 RepID=A0A0A8Y8W3_ARUDO